MGKRRYDGSAKRAGGPLPVRVPYDVLENAEAMKHFLKDLIALVLARRILPRQASACRACLETSLRIDDHELLEDLERRLQELEKERQVKE